MTRTEAAERGLLRYLGDKPCKYGHNPERYTSTGNCVACGLDHRKRHQQKIAGSGFGWPSVRTHVPLHVVDTLRTIVHDLRVHGPDGDRRRALYAELVQDIRSTVPREPVVDALEVQHRDRPMVDPMAAYVPKRFGGAA